jgi:nucleotide-binding universal stress UspA family protein
MLKNIFMKTIIAPTDFSAVSLNAVNYAADMACVIQGNLVLLHVCRLPVAYSEMPVPADSISGMIKDAEENILQLRQELINRTKGAIQINTEVKTGMVTDEIQKFSDVIAPYAIVMGPHETGPAERLFFGSNTIAAMKHLSWPLIVVPQEAKFTSIRKVGLACDLNRVVETSPVEEIKMLVKQFQAELHVVHVNREDEQAYTPETIEESGLLQEMLDELHPVYHFLNNVNIDEGLSGYAEKNKLDLLIVIPKKHGLIEKLFHKSHTKQLILHSHIPVMSVHE